MTDLDTAATEMNAAIAAKGIKLVWCTAGGWNDSREFFAVRNGQRFSCGEVMKGERNDWSAAFDAVVCADVAS